jgi:glycosyltransferase involved in cell wall biosynthesis
MRIVVQALPTSAGGGLTLLRDLLAAWPSEDELLVLAWREPTVSLAEALGHQVVKVGARSTGEALVRTARTPRPIRRFEPDVLWSQAVRLPWRGLPQAIHYQDLGRFQPIHRRTIRSAAQGCREARDIRSVDVRIFNSQAMLNAARQRYPVVADRPSAVVHNGLDIAPFRTAAMDAPPVGGLLRILLPQSDSPHKRNALAATVVTKVSEQLPRVFAGVELVVPGEGDYADLRRAHAIEGRVGSLLLMGSQDRRGMADLYRSCHVVLITSRGESFCNPAIEAAASGRPLVAVPLAVLAESGGPLCRMTSSSRAEELAAAVITAAQSPTSATERAAALAHAEKFSATVAVSRLRSVLLDLTDRASSQASRAR